MYLETLVADPPISCEPPTLEETRKALGQLKDGKAPGTCGVYAEMLKAGGESALKGLHRLFYSVWNSGPDRLEDGHCCPHLEGQG